MDSIDWSLQVNGVHRASFDDMVKVMPDLACIKESFPEDVNDFTWDVKVHMLMPNQFPCIPNWHFDNVPRVNNKQDFDKVDSSLPMYLWISGEPLTEFRNGGLIAPRTWKRFTQKDEHRGTMAKDFTWRGFVRATHNKILAANPSGESVVRRHSQVYLDSNNFSW